MRSAPNTVRKSGDPFDPDNYDFNQLLYVQEFRTDKVRGGQLDVSRKGNLFGASSEIAFGGKARLRDKNNNRSEYSGDPSGYGYERTLDDLPLFTQNMGYGYSSFYPNLAPSLQMFREARDALLANDPNFQREDNPHGGAGIIADLGTYQIGVRVVF